MENVNKYLSSVDWSDTSFREAYDIVEIKLLRVLTELRLIGSVLIAHFHIISIFIPIPGPGALRLRFDLNEKQFSQPGSRTPTIQSHHNSNRTRELSRITVLVRLSCPAIRLVSRRLAHWSQKRPLPYNALRGLLV